MKADTPTAQGAAMAPRALAFVAGTIILGAATYAAIVKGNMDSATALLTCAISGGVLAGSVIVGRAFAAGLTKIGLGITAAIICGELYSAWLTGERVIAMRETAQIVYRRQAGAHSYAQDKLTEAHKRLDRAEATLKAARETAQTQGVLTSCKAVCKANNETAITGAEQDRKAARADYDAAVEVYDANEKPQPVVTLADKLGMPAWVADVGLAVLLSVGVNGLATLLIAFASHGSKSARVIERHEEPQVPADPTPRKSRRGATEKDANVVSFISRHTARHGRPPNVSELRAAFPQHPRTTLQGYLTPAPTLRAVA